ncbi:MAG: hypothetical protein U0V74_04655 [Chitinophagales bacterium]
MATTDPLFDLIKSLSPAEKRHFRLVNSLAGNKEDGVMLRIYDIIDKMDVFDEETLKKKLKDPALLKNLSSNKLKLRERLADIVTEFNYQTGIVAEIKFLIRKAEVLFERNLGSIAYDVLLKARTKAELYDLPLLQMEINAIESKFMQSKPGVLEQNNAAGLVLLKKMQNLYEYYAELATYVQVIRSNGLSSPAFTQQIDKMDAMDLFAKEEYPQTFLAKDQFYSIRVQIARNRRNQTDFYKWTQKLLELWDANPHMKELYPVRFVHSSQVLQLLAQDIWDEPKQPAIDFRDACFAQMEMHRSFLRKHRASNLPIALMELDIICAQMLLYSAFKMGKELAAFYDSIIGTLTPKNYKVNTYYLATVKVVFAQNFFALRDYDRTLDCVNQVMNEKDEAYTSATYTSSFINLLVHLQLKNDLLIDSLLQQLQRWLEKNNLKQNEEKKTMLFLKKYTGANESERKQLLQENLPALINEADKSNEVFCNEVIPLLQTWMNLKKETKQKQGIA